MTSHAKRLFGLALSLLAVSGAWAGRSAMAALQAPQPAPAAAPEPAAPPAGQTTKLSPDIPYDVVLTGSTLEAAQRDFDQFAWEMFVALNWTVDASGKVDPQKVIGSAPSGDNPTVWETWKEAGGIIRAGGKPPTPWGAPPEIPPVCRFAGGPSKVIAQAGKVPLPLLVQSEQAFKMGPLIDQNGVYARYEIVVDQPMFDYIVANQLYSRAGQQSFKGQVEFPFSDLATKTLGSIMVKAAWKILGAGDDPSRFHVSEALVYTPASENPPVQESCAKEKLGLVGLHIVARTKSAPQWIWTTFEQVDNAPDYPVQNAASHYNFYAPGSGAPINTVAPQPWDPAKKGPPTQVARLSALTAATQTINSQYQALLAAVNPRSVWQYYELINTQWPASPNDPRNPLGRPTPPFLANTTMETYIQGALVDGKVELVPQGTSSCMNCHNNATLTTAAPSGFSYLLSQAQ
ncbi:MAG TPA: cytochrome C [Thermoanaerobaculia bacterium]